MRINKKFRVCILGSGFGGIFTLINLKNLLGNNSNIEVTLISNSNHFLFTPLLHEVATGEVEPENIVYPVKKLEKEYENFIFYCENILELDLKNKQVVTVKQTVAYDCLVISLGSVINFYGNDSLAKNSLTLKNLNDAVEIKSHVEKNLKEAIIEKDPERKKALTTFVIAGGGATGSELTGNLVFFIREKIKEMDITPEIKIYLVEMGNNLLQEMKSKQCSNLALKRFKEIGVEVLLNHKVIDYNGNNLKILNKDLDIEINIPTETFVWTAGVKTNPLINELNVKKDKQGRIIVDKYLTLPEYPEVFAIGDNASVKGKNYLTTAQTAQQQAETVAYNLYSKTELFSFSKPFRYFHQGTLITIGKGFGISDLFGVKITGLPGWFACKTIHLAKAMGTHNKINIIYNWLKNIINNR